MLDVIKRFDGVPLDYDRLSNYEKWALKYFHDGSQVVNPLCEVTLQMDITDADKTYRKKYCKTQGASFTAYLTWALIQAFKGHPCFNYRKVNGNWYFFRNLPLYFPLLVGGRERFNEVLIEGAFQFDWGEFCRNYRAVIDNTLKKKAAFVPIDEDVFSLSLLISNIPNMQFTSVSMHVSKRKFGRPAFYFGKRYINNGRLFTPLYIVFDHSNVDPYVMGLLFEDYNKILTEEEDRGYWNALKGD